MSTCSYCRLPITAQSLPGRVWPDAPATAYCCYGCLSLGEIAAERIHANSGQTTRQDPIWWKLGLSLLLAGQSMMLGLTSNLASPGDAARFWLAAATAVCAAVVAALLAPPLIHAAWEQLRQRKLSIEVLFLTTMLGTVGASVQGLIDGRSGVYFEVVNLLLVVYTVNKLVGARSRASALRLAREWARPLSHARRVRRDGTTARVAVESVRPGDLIDVSPGQWIPVDGIVHHGVAFVRDTPMTGEPFVQVRRPGDHVLAGSVVEDASLQVRCTSSGGKRRIDAVLAAVDDGDAQPLRLQEQASRMAAWMLPAVVSIAVATFCFWTLRVDWREGLFNAMAVLLVACPCALGLATPIAVWTAHGRFARRGLLMRRHDMIERFAATRRVILDKTGTLSDQRWGVVDLVTRPGGIPRERLLAWLRAVQSRSAHPVARALSGLAPTEPGEVPSHVQVRIVPGRGIAAELRDTQKQTHQLRIGPPERLSEDGQDPEEAWVGQLVGVDGHRIGVEVDGELAAVALLRERFRDSATDAINQLQQLGLRVELMTGDRQAPSGDFGFDRVQIGLKPEEKRQRVQDYEQQGDKCLFVGDGVNDASALSVAHAGIALASGTDLAVAAAPATLYGDDLRTIGWAIVASRQTLTTIRGNLAWAVAYNGVGIALACTGWLHPVAASLLMLGSVLVKRFFATGMGGVSVH